MGCIKSCNGFSSIITALWCIFTQQTTSNTKPCFLNVIYYNELNQLKFKNADKEAIARVNFTLQENQIERWWPNGYGNQKLYNLTVAYKPNNLDENTSKTIKVAFRWVKPALGDSTYANYQIFMWLLNLFILVMFLLTNGNRVGSKSFSLKLSSTLNTYHLLLLCKMIIPLK